MSDKIGLTLDRDKLYARAEELMNSAESEDEQRFYSENLDDEQPIARTETEETEPESKVSASPADAPAQAPASSPESAPLQQQVPPQAGTDLNQELVDMNRQLLEMLRTRPPRATHQTQQQHEQASPEQYDENSLVLHGELAPVRQQLGQLNSQLAVMKQVVVQREVANARAQYEQFKKDHPDCDELVDPKFVEQAINGLGQIVGDHFAKGQVFSYDFRKDLQQDYDLADVKRLREKQKVAAAEAEMKAKQEAELQKVSGVPKQGARYQAPSEGTKKRKADVDPGAGFTDRIRARAEAAINRFRGNT